MTRTRASLAASALLILAACSPPSEPAGEGANEAEAATGEPAGLPVRATGAPILLETLAPADLQAAELEGELGCSFSAARNDEPLFLGMANVIGDEGAQGLVRIDGDVSPLSMDAVGGYDRMAQGARFSAGQLSLSFEVKGGTPLPEDPPVAGELPLREARMVVARGDRRLAIDGFWECGP